MTFKDRFGCFENYQKYEAQKMMDFEREGKIYSESQYKHIDCFKYPEIYMNKQELEEKRKKIDNIERLQRILNGKENSQIYLIYWEYLKDTEYST
jgi:uncharacterized protein YcbK (DUF882 family)